jgi:acyl-CoA reductase-like NAD-dependent aldehyde dehydrogenase
MLDLTEAQLVELVLVAAKRGYKQSVDDAKRRAAEECAHFSQEGIDAYRQQALTLLRKRLGELRELKANELLVAGFNEAVEYLEYGVDKDWADIKKGPAKGA